MNKQNSAVENNNGIDYESLPISGEGALEVLQDWLETRIEPTLILQYQHSDRLNLLVDSDSRSKLSLDFPKREESQRNTLELMFRNIYGLGQYGFIGGEDSDSLLSILAISDQTIDVRVDCQQLCFEPWYRGTNQGKTFDGQVDMNHNQEFQLRINQWAS